MEDWKSGSDIFIRIALHFMLCALCFALYTLMLYALCFTLYALMGGEFNHFTIRPGVASHLVICDIQITFVVNSDSYRERYISRNSFYYTGWRNFYNKTGYKSLIQGGHINIVIIVKDQASFSCIINTPGQNAHLSGWGYFGYDAII